MAHLNKAAKNDQSVIVGLISSHIALGNVGQAVQQVEQIKVNDPTASLAQACELVVQITQRQALLLKNLHPPKGKEEAWKPAIGCLACAEYAHKVGLPADRVETLLAACFAENIEAGPAYALRSQLALEKAHLGRGADRRRASPQAGARRCPRPLRPRAHALGAKH